MFGFAGGVTTDSHSDKRRNVQDAEGFRNLVGIWVPEYAVVSRICGCFLLYAANWHWNCSCCVSRTIPSPLTQDLKARESGCYPKVLVLNRTV